MNQYASGNIEPNGRQSPDRDFDFDVKGLFYKVLRNWYVILIFLGLAFAAAQLYLRYTVPIYQTKSTILIKAETKNSGNIQAENAVLQELTGYSPTNNLINEIHILRSRSLMEQVVEELGLNISYFQLGRIQSKELYGNSSVKVDTIIWYEGERALTLNIDFIDNVKCKVSGGEGEKDYFFGTPLVLHKDTIILSRDLAIEGIRGDQLIISVQPKLSVASQLKKNLSVEIAQDFSSVLNLSLQSALRRKAVDVLDKLVEVYNRDAIADKSEVDRKTLSFINERLSLLTSELSAVEGEVESYKEQNQIPTEAGANIEQLLAEVFTYDNQLVQLEVKLNLLDSIQNAMSDPRHMEALIPANTMLGEEGALIEQIRLYNEILLRLDRLSGSATGENPMVAELEHQLSEYRRAIMASVVSVRQNLELIKRRTQNKLDELERRIGMVPRLERELLEIKRQQNIKQGLYLYLLQKKEETALSSAITVGKARVIDPALASGIPISPKPLRIYGLFTLLGLALPIGFIFLRDLLDDKIYSEEDIRSLTGIPVLGSVAQSSSGSSIVVHPNSRTPISEMFRLLRTNLNFLGAGKGYEVIMVTSGLGGDGKTFTAVNLGLTLSLTGKKVVLVGMDLRKPKLAEYLVSVEDQSQAGVSSYLIGSEPLERVVIPSDTNENLFFIPSGPIPPNPAELLESERTEDLIRQLREQFDYVMIDTAPLGLVADALLLTEQVDISLYVVRHGKTPAEMLKKLEKMRKEGRLKNPAIILNGVKAGSGYGYGYGYGYYANDTNKKKKKARKSIFKR